MDERFEWTTHPALPGAGTYRGRFQLTEDSRAFESNYGHIWTIREGKALRCEAVELDQALALAGRR